MDARTVRVTQKRTFDFGGLPAGAASVVRVRTRVGTVRHRGATLLVRVHSADVAAGSDGQIRVKVRSMGYTPSQPETAFEGAVVADVVAVVDGTGAGELVVKGFAVRGGALQVEVEGTQDSGQASQALEAALSIDLVLSDVAEPLLKLQDGEMSRASDAWWARDDGRLVKKSHAGVLRAPRGGRYVLEGAVTQMINDDPVDISATGLWTLQGTPPTAVRKVAMAPDGSFDANRLEFAAASDRFIAGSGTPTGGATVQVSVWARTESGTDTFRLAFNDGVSVQLSGPHTATASWQRFESAFTVDASPTTGDMRIYGEGSGATTILAWGAMAQQDVSDFHPAPVLAASATKAADDLSFTALDGSPLFDEGFWLYCWPYFDDAEQIAYGTHQYVLWPTGGRFLRFQGTQQGRIRVGGDLGSVSSAIHTWSARQRLTIVVDFASGELRTAGFTAGNGTTDISGAGDWSGETALHVGNVSAPFFGEISDLYALDSAPV